MSLWTARAPHPPWGGVLVGGSPNEPHSTASYLASCHSRSAPAPRPPGPCRRRRSRPCAGERYAMVTAAVVSDRAVVTRSRPRAPCAWKRSESLCFTSREYGVRVSGEGTCAARSMRDGAPTAHGRIQAHLGERYGAHRSILSLPAPCSVSWSAGSPSRGSLCGRGGATVSFGQLWHGRQDADIGKGWGKKRTH